MNRLRNWRGVEEGEKNRKAVRAWFAAHLCGTQAECAKELGLSVTAVSRHAQQIRAEWQDKRRSSDERNQARA